METVQILTAGARVDPYKPDEPIYDDWSHPVPVEVELQVPPEPRPSSEPVLDARNSVTSGWTLYLPAGTAVTSHNRVLVRGVTYKVDGEPAGWADMGVVVQVTEKAG